MGLHQMACHCHRKETEVDDDRIVATCVLQGKSCFL
jgi:hypothetical protein